MELNGNYVCNTASMNCTQNCNLGNMVEESMRKGRVQPAKAADNLLFFDILIIRHSKLNKENKKKSTLSSGEVSKDLHQLPL